MLLFLFLNDFCQTYYLNIYQAELHEIYRVGTIMTVYERFEVIFSIPERALPLHAILWAKSRPNPHNWVRVTFARAAYDKTRKCFTVHTETN